MHVFVVVSVENFPTMSSRPRTTVINGLVDDQVMGLAEHARQAVNLGNQQPGLPGHVPIRGVALPVPTPHQLGMDAGIPLA